MNYYHLFRFFMYCMFSAKSAIFFKLKLVRSCTFILCSRIIPSFTFTAYKSDNYSHQWTPSIFSYYSNKSENTITIHYSIISLTTPAPTVRPPSLTANLNSFSIAIGVINSASIVTLSPGITISTPSGNVRIPVTSVVRK